jgi:hypothetical protein
MTPGQNQQPLDISRLQDVAMNVVYNVCGIICMPVEMALRPFYGSRYFPPMMMMFSIFMMLLLPLFESLTEGFDGMIPFLPHPAPVGLFGIGAFSKFFFIGLFVHGFRIWRRMIHMDREQNSLFEGPPLFIFNLLPGTFWRVRIVYEPLFLLALSVVLPNFLILQPSAAHYLTFAAFALAMKQYVAWFMQWQFLRGLMDMRNAGPIVAKFVDNTATEDDLATIHLASLPRDIPEEVRRDTAEHIARAMSPGSKHGL